MWSAYQTIRPSESKAGSRPFRTPRSGSSIFSCSSTCSRSKRIRCGGPRLPESLPRRSRDGLAGDVQAALQATHAIVHEAGPGGRELLRGAAQSTVDKLASGRLARHLVVQLRKVDDDGVEPIATVSCRRPPNRQGARRSVDDRGQHPRSSTLARPVGIRRGRPRNRRAVEAVAESDSAPHGNRAVTHVRRARCTNRPGRHARRRRPAGAARGCARARPRRIAWGDRNRAAGARRRRFDHGSPELMGLRDEKVAPLLCPLLARSKPRGLLIQLQTQIMDALGGLGGHPDSCRRFGQRSTVANGGRRLALQCCAGPQRRHCVA